MIKSLMSRLNYCLIAFYLLICAFTVQAQAQALPPAPSAPEGRVMLPQQQQYQKVLRDYMATLTEEDFTHGVSEKMSVAETDLDTETLYRIFLKTLMVQPLVGQHIGIPAVNSPAWLFLLSSIEGPIEAKSRQEAVKGFEASSKPPTLRPGPVPEPAGIVLPPVWPEALISFTNWEYPGNPFYNNRGLKMRAFVTAVVNMIMLDDFYSAGNQNRSDWNSYKLVSQCLTYRGMSDLLPEKVREAYLEGIRRFGERIMEWGIRGEEPNLDIIAVVALWHAAEILQDADFSANAEAYSRRLLADPRYFHPAGYWIERGGFDTGFGGMTSFFAIWTALASDWDFAAEAVKRVYRLRAHLSLPDPDGMITGPSHFNSRLGTQAAADQWEWNGARDLAGLMVTEEAAPAVSLLEQSRLEDSPKLRINAYSRQLHSRIRNPANPFNRRNENYGYVLDEDIRGRTWRWTLWDNNSYPIMINPAYEFYKPGAYEELQQLVKEKPEMFQLPCQRGEVFLRNFSDAFFAVRQQEFAAVLHTGAVGPQDPDDGLVHYGGPMGFGGGQLSAFWTPETGSVILGRRIGMRPGHNYDNLKIWRLWPVHAVSGITAAGKIFSTSRILEPELQVEVKETSGIINVSGIIPANMLGQEKVLQGQLSYERSFQIKADAIKVETVLTVEGDDEITELYETLPVYLKDTRHQAELDPTAVTFKRHNGEWVEATAEYHSSVTAVRLARFSGMVEIIFSEPQRVKLSPEVWNDTWITRASCRNLLIDMLQEGNPGKRSISYRIAPVTGNN